MPGNDRAGLVSGRPRPTAEELFADACCEPTPNPHHVRLILQGATGVEYRLRLIRRGITNALVRARLSPEDRTRLARYLDYFDVDGERRRRERRALIEEQRQRLLAASENSEVSGGVPGGPYPS